MPIFIASPSVLKYRWSSTWIVAFFNSNRTPLQFLQGGNLRPLTHVAAHFDFFRRFFPARFADGLRLLGEPNVPSQHGTKCMATPPR